MSDEIEVRKSKRRRRRRIGCGVALGLAMALTGLATIDGSPPEDADLILEFSADVPDGESFISGLIQVHGEIIDVPEMGDWVSEVSMNRDVPRPIAIPSSPRALDREVWNDALADEMAAWFEGPAASLKKFDDILEIPAFDSALGTSDEYPQITPLRALTYFLRDRALLSRIRNDTAEASRDLDRIRRLGERFVREGRSLVDVLVGVAVIGTARTSANALLHDGDLAPEIEARWLELEPLFDREPALRARAFRADYSWIRAKIVEAGSGELMGLEQAPPFVRQLFFKPNRTLVGAATEYRKLIDRGNTPRVERGPYWGQELKDGARMRALLRVNTGELFIAMLSPNLERVIDQFDSALLESRVSRALIALRRYERTHAALPPDLETLIAAIEPLDAVPLDPYSGKALGYDPARRILWSVGDDGVDNGGEGWQQRRDDLEVRRHELPDWVWLIPPIPGS